jgi:hypothetical protein
LQAFARRQNRRAGYYAAGVVGAGALAAGTAGAVAAATAPNYWGWGNNAWGNNNWGNNNWGNAYAAQADPYFGQAHYVHRAYHGISPYYGHSGWDDYKTRNAISCAPGTMTKLSDGQMYLCQ